MFQVNREHISGYSWDHEFLGNSDEVVEFISSKLGSAFS